MHEKKAQQAVILIGFGAQGNLFFLETQRKALKIKDRNQDKNGLRRTLYERRNKGTCR